MGESKRRQDKLGQDYGKAKPILPWVPITQEQASQFVAITTKGAWIGIGLMAALWITVRFVGPGFGWWDVQG